MHNENNNRTKIGFISLLLGFIAGALLVILSDPDNRKKLKEKSDELMDNTKDKSKDLIGNIATTVKTSAEKVQQKVQSTLDHATETIDAEIEKASK
jgi:gas vesicle protein